MKNKMKKFGTQSVLFCVVALLIVLVASCATSSNTSGAGAEKVGRAAMFTHNNSIGEAIVVLRGDTVVSVKFDDYFGPQIFGNLTNVGNRGDAATIQIGTTVYAKSIRVGTETFTIADGATEPAYAGTHRGTTITNLQQWLGSSTTRQGGNYGDNVPSRTPEEWLWYIDACKNGQIVFLTANGTPASIRPIGYGSNWQLSKNSSTYWGADGAPIAYPDQLGWKLNHEAIEAYATRRNVQFPDPLAGPANGGNTASLTRRADNVWQFSNADVISGATMVDTPNYLKLIQLACQNAK